MQQRAVAARIFIAVSIAIAFAVDYCEAQCQTSYDPSAYIGNTHVPTTCSVSVPTTCPRSWKAGVDGGRSTNLPLIDELFVTCHEGTSQCGYVPIDSGTGQVAGSSGVTIGAGVDLGSRTRSSLSSAGITSTTLLNKLDPYFGLTQSAAACTILERPLIVTSSEASSLTAAVRNGIVADVEQRYNQDRSTNALPFRSIPRGIRTAIADVWFQFGPQDAYPNFWRYVTRNEWESAVRELRNFYSNPERQLRSDLRRRNNEADIIEATFNGTCRRSIDAVFLLDESGSVSSSDFRKAKEFVRAVISAFPDENINQTDGSRFGLSLFDDSYRTAFYLSNYTTISQYVTAVADVSQKRGNTNLGSALTRILTDQFTEARGLRPETSGLPRILIVVTDGESGDDVSQPARNLHNRNIVVYGIGVGGFDRTQLNTIASSSSHVYELSSFSALSDFASTLTASTCNEPQPVSLETEITGSIERDSFHYYKFGVNDSSYLRIDVYDINGRTLMYASRDNPHPYKYDNTFGFILSRSSRKSIVIRPQASPSTGLTQPSSLLRFAYVAITAYTPTATYTIEASTCSALVCQEGTEEVTTEAITEGTTEGSTEGTTSSKASFLHVPSMLISFAIIGIVALTV